MFDWFRRRSTSPALIEADTNEIIARFGDEAYSQARLRSDGEPYEGPARSRHHWLKVKNNIRPVLHAELGAKREVAYDLRV